MLIPDPYLIGTKDRPRASLVQCALRSSNSIRSNQPGSLRTSSIFGVLIYTGELSKSCKRFAPTRGRTEPRWQAQPTPLLSERLRRAAQRPPLVYLYWQSTRNPSSTSRLVCGQRYRYPARLPQPLVVNAQLLHPRQPRTVRDTV